MPNSIPFSICNLKTSPVSIKMNIPQNLESPIISKNFPPFDFATDDVMKRRGCLSTVAKRKAKVASIRGLPVKCVA
jgi:hypothetical protein